MQNDLTKNDANAKVKLIDPKQNDGKIYKMT